MNNKIKGKTVAYNKVLFIILPVIVLSLIFSGTASYYLFKHYISDTVSRDLQSMVEICSAFSTELIDGGTEREVLLDELEGTFENMNIGNDGFCFVVDLEGNLLVHRAVGNVNWIDKPHIQKIILEKNGFHRYLSPETRTFKISAFRYLPKADFIIVATAFEDDFIAEPLRSMVTFLFIVIAVIAVAGFLFFALVVPRETD